MNLFQFGGVHFVHIQQFRMVLQGIRKMAEKIKEHNIEGHALKTELQFEIEDLTKFKNEEPLFHENVSTLNVAIKPNSRCKAKDKECEICGEKFQSLSHLKVHMRKHNGEKPFSCKICFISFSTSNNLKVHLYAVTLYLGFGIGACSCPESRRSMLGVIVA